MLVTRFQPKFVKCLQILLMKLDQPSNWNSGQFQYPEDAKIGFLPIEKGVSEGIPKNIMI